MISPRKPVLGAMIGVCATSHTARFKQIDPNFGENFSIDLNSSSLVFVLINSINDNESMDDDELSDADLSIENGLKNFLIDRPYGMKSVIVAGNEYVMGILIEIFESK